MQDASKYGWQLDPSVPHQWHVFVAYSLSREPLRTGVQNYIKSMNWGYRVKLREAKVNYVNALASFSSPHTLRYTDRTKEEVRKFFSLSIERNLSSSDSDSCGRTSALFRHSWKGIRHH